MYLIFFKVRIKVDLFYEQIYVIMIREQENHYSIADEYAN